MENNNLQGYKEYNDELFNEIEENEDLNFSIESIENNHNKYIEDKDETKERNNLINEFNNKQFKSNLYTFENNILNFSFYKQKEELIKENKIPVKQPKRLLMRKEDFTRLNKEINFKKQLKIEREEQEIEGRDTISNNNNNNTDIDKKNDKKNNKELSRRGEEILNNKDSYDFKNLYHFLTEDDYFNFIFVFLIIKFYVKSKSNAYVDLEECYLHNKDNNSRDFIELRKEIKLFNDEIEEDASFKKLITVKSKTPPQTILTYIREFGNTHNKNNIYLLNYLYLVHTNPLFKEEKIYKTWKLYLGKILAIWDYKDQAGITDSLPLKYLVCKKLIQKLFKEKEKGKFLNYKISKRQKEGNLLDLLPIEANDDIPRFSFSPDSNVTLIYNLVFDLFLSFTFITLPMIYILKLDSFFFLIINVISNGIYLFYIIKSFRDLTFDNMNNLEKDLNKIFATNMFNIYFLIDILSIMPFDILNSDGGSPDFPNNSYLNWKFFMLVRYPRLGKSSSFFEKTKYAAQFRLLVLMGKFVLIALWMGLFFTSFFESDTYNKNFNRSASCSTNNLNDKIKSSCLFMDALYIGGYLVPGKALLFPPFYDEEKTTFQYFYIFLAFFIGQIITANVFSNVSDIINSLNESENKYKEIRDEHRLIEYFYKIEDDTSQLVQNYYSYLWLKHKEDIYGKSLFHNLSKKMKKSFNKAMIPGYQCMIRELMDLTTTDNKFIIYIISILEKYIAIPYERVITQGSVIKGLFFLYNGRLFLTDEPELTSKRNIYNFNFDGKLAEIKKEQTRIRLNEKRRDLEGEMVASKKRMLEKIESMDDKIIKDDTENSDKTIFPLDSIFIKTGRAVETMYCKTYCDLFYIPLRVFDNNLLINYPNEMHKLSITARDYGAKKVGNDAGILKIVLEHSCRSVGKYYENEFNTNNMWIEVPIVIPKFKIKYFSNLSLRDKVNNSGTSGLLEIDFNRTRMLINTILNKDINDE